MKSQVDESTRSFGAGILIRHLTALGGEIAGVRENKDIEPVHRMRVAARRFRSTLPLFASCFPARDVHDWMQSVRKIGGALGDARDTDVKIERLKAVLVGIPDKSYRVGIHRLMLRLKQNRAAQQIKILKLLDRLETGQTLQKITEKIGSSAVTAEIGMPFSSQLYRTAYRSIDGYRQALLEYEAVVDRPEMKVELHQMRVAAKRLRYALEAFAPLYSPDLNGILKITRSIQDQLGTLHDLDVWEAFLEDYRTEETRRTLEYYGYTWPVKRHWAGIDFLRMYFSEQRGDTYTRFRDSWHGWTDTETWGRLHRMIALPVSLSREVYPPRPEPQPAPDTDGTNP